MTHIWIIMDWNRRWAKNLWKTTLEWHTAWAKNIKNILNYGIQQWISHITLWALSTENIKNRSKLELEWLYMLISKIPEYIDEWIENNIKINIIGNLELLPKKVQKILQQTQEKTEKNTGLVCTLAIAYGWQDEIIRWIQKFSQEWWDIDHLTSENFREYLDTGTLPALDLMIRTGWDMRMSGFLLYASAYSEYYFTDKKWPEFSETDFDLALAKLDTSKRNFWK